MEAPSIPIKREQIETIKELGSVKYINHLSIILINAINPEITISQWDQMLRMASTSIDSNYYFLFDHLPSLINIYDSDLDLAICFVREALIAQIVVNVANVHKGWVELGFFELIFKLINKFNEEFKNGPDFLEIDFTSNILPILNELKIDYKNYFEEGVLFVDTNTETALSDLLVESWENYRYLELNPASLLKIDPEISNLDQENLKRSLLQDYLEKGKPVILEIMSFYSITTEANIELYQQIQPLVGNLRF